MTGPDPRPGDDVVELAVVCTGNIARSPLVMALLEHEARRRLGAEPPVWVRSSGVHGLEGSPAAEESRALAAARGLDLSAHRGAVTSREEIASSDLVLTMTEHQRRHVCRLAPTAATRTFTLREFARLLAAVRLPDGELPPRDRVRQVAERAHAARAVADRAEGPEDIVDPYGGPRHGYERLAAELDELIPPIAEALFGAPR